MQSQNLLKQTLNTCEALDVIRNLAALEDVRFVFDGEAVRLAVSIGVVESDSELATSTGVMQAADVARNVAKAAGGGCLRVYGAVP